MAELNEGEGVNVGVNVGASFSELRNRGGSKLNFGGEDSDGKLFMAFALK